MYLSKKAIWSSLKIGLVVVSGCIVPVMGSAQIKISPYLIGQNAWEQHSILKVKDQISAVHFQSVRIGGNTYEKADFISQSALSLIDYVRASGAEPIVQLPRQLKNNDDAYKAIAYINGKMGKHIRFWSIGNEPDHKHQPATAEEVRDYFTKISAQIKRYDPAAIVFGFDLSSYNLSYLNRLLGGDLDVTGKVPGKEYYYLDNVTFHQYKFMNITKIEANVNDLKSRLASINIKRPVGQQIGWAITEFNTHWMVDPTLNEAYLPYNFHNGQIYAEMYDLGMRKGAFAMCPWSMLEGGAKRTGTDLSLFDLEDDVYKPRSNYYHSALLARFIKSKYLSHSPNSDDLVVIPTGDESGISVMILNKNKTSGQHYTLAFKHQIGRSTSAVIAIHAELEQEFKGNITAFSTQMLVFDQMGKLIKAYEYSAKDSHQKTGPRDVMSKLSIQ